MGKRCLLLLLLLSFVAPTAVSAATLKDDFLTLAKGTGLAAESQSACFEDRKGAPVLSVNPDMRIIPASVSKLYVFDFALSELPADFRYTTTFYLFGKTLYINGGGDPHFVNKHLRSVLAKIYAEKKVVIDTFVFSPEFYFDWQSKPKEIQSALFRSLKSNAGAPIAPKIKVVIGTSKYKGAGDRYEFQSAPLSALLKQINDYSTNISADVLFNRLGGYEKFSLYMKETYGAGSDTIAFRTGSGLSGNYTTCDLTLRVIRHLHQQIEDKGLVITDIMSVPTVDPGVLKKRLINVDDAAALVAKSGFVNYHHSLAGVINTKKGPLYFAVFTDFNDMKKSAATKGMIDRFISVTLERYRKTLKSFNYTPDFTLLESVKISRL